MNMDAQRWWEGVEQPPEPALITLKDILPRVPTKHRVTVYRWIKQGRFVSGSTTTRVGLIGLTSGRDQAARRARFWSAQVHGSSSSSFCIGQPLTSLARVSAR